jgi:hypothetical protein
MLFEMRGVHRELRLLSKECAAADKLGRHPSKNGMIRNILGDY